MSKLTSVLSVLIVFIVWHILASHQVISPEFFPSPFTVLNRLFILLNETSFLKDIGQSGIRLLIATLLSVFSAAVLSFTCAHNKLIDKIITPFVGLTYPLPKVAIIPLLMLIFGIGNFSKIVIISIGMFYLLFIHLRHSIKFLINSPLALPVHIYKVKGKNYYFHFLFKGILLDFFKSFKVAIGYGLTLVVVSELSMTREGIGNFIWKSWDQFRILDMYAGVYFLCLLGLLIYSLLDYLIAKLTPRYYT